MKERIKQLTEYPLLIIFGAIIAVFFFGYVLIPQQEKSEWENRYLSLRPDFSLIKIKDGDFMTDFESYTNDQVIFRDPLVKFKGICEAILLKNTNNGISKGKDGYLFTEDYSNGKVFKKNIDIISSFVEESGRNIGIIIAPNAAGIIGDRIPRGMPVLNQRDLIKGAEGKISLLKNLRVIDLLEVLDNNKNNQLYYKTDHHWTTYAAGLAYEKFADRKLNLDACAESEVGDFYGTLYAKYKGPFVSSDTITYYNFPIKTATFGEEEVDSLYDLSKVDVFDKYGLFLYGNFGKSVIKTGTVTDKEIIVFKDSYANCFIPYLTTDYAKITVVDLRYYGESVQELLESNEKAEILLLYNFDFLNEDNHFWKLMK